MSDLCGCCTAGAPEARVENRPELSAIAYRVGTFAAFRHALLREIADRPELAGLRTRLSDDYSITLIELWAAVADILTFYQERIANEGFLRTARLRDSLLRMVRLLGYELRPGAAATTRLAFTLEPNTTLTIPAGLRVQSVPADGEKPQKFETLESIEGDARLNRLRVLPAPIVRNPLAAGSAHAYLSPDDDAPPVVAALRPGDRVLLWSTGAIEELTIRQVDVEEDRIRLEWEPPVQLDDWNAEAAALKYAQTFRLFGHGAPATYMAPITTTDATTGVVTITGWEQLPTDRTYVDTQRLRLDGRYDVRVGTQLLVVVRQTSGASVAVTRTRVTAASLVPETVGPLRDTVTQLTIDPAFDVPAGWSVDRADVLIHAVTGRPLRFWPYDLPSTITAPPVYVSGRRHGWHVVEVGRAIAEGKYRRGVRLDTREIDRTRPVLLLDSRNAAVPGELRGARPVSTMVVIGPTPTDPTTAGEVGFGATAQVVSALVSRAIGLGPGPSEIVPRELTVTMGAGPPRIARWTGALSYIYEVAPALEAALRAADSTSAFARARVVVTSDQPEALRLIVIPGALGESVEFAPTPNDGTTVTTLGLDRDSVRILDGLMSAPLSATPTISRDPARFSIAIGFHGPRVAEGPAGSFTDLGSAAAWVAEAIRASVLVDERGNSVPMPPSFRNATVEVFLDDRLLLVPGIEPAVQDYVRLHLSTDAALNLDARTAVLVGNVAPASHGETVRNELVGDADAARPFLRFPLRRKPVTYVPAPVPGGVRSSLHLFVNGVEWREKPTLYGAAARDEIFVSRIADDGTLTVLFGDGEKGARPPTGRANIVATYRQGIGLAGRVRASSLTTLLDRPTGLKAATNPAAADGGADPETLAHAREAAPGTARTFGRAVSLRDFEDVVLASGEVAKAAATWVWAGEARAIHLTVAGQAGGTFTLDALERIRATFDVERDPNLPLLIDNYTRVPVVVVASLHVGDRYVAADAVAAARAVLLARLSFDALRFGQPVYLSDVYQVLQQVPGVVAVDVDDLDFKSQDPAFRTAHGATAQRPQPSLRILPARPEAGPPVRVLPAELAWVESPSQDVTLRASGGVTA